VAQVVGYGPLGESEGNTGASSLPLKPQRWRTAITSTRLPLFAGVALISHVLPGLKVFE
jgi:hypothetical protein